MFIRLLKYLGVTLGSLLMLIMVLVIVLLATARWSIQKDLPLVDAKQSLLLTNVNVVDVIHGTILPAQQVKIAAGRIRNIASMTAPQLSAERIIDTQNAYLMPGLTDMHVHIHDRKDLVAHLAYGVTSVRNLSGSLRHLRWQQELHQQQWLGSNMITSSPIMGNTQAWLFHQAVTSPQHGRKLVSRFAKQGYDLIKVYGYLSNNSLTAILKQAEQEGIAIAKHAPHAGKVLPLSVLQHTQSLEHVEDVFQGPLDYRFDASLLPEYLAELAALEVFITPTLAAFAHLTWLSENKQHFVEQLPLEQINPFFRGMLRQLSVSRWLAASQKQIDWNKKELDFLLEITKAMDDRGIRLLVGSDAGVMYMTGGISTLSEIELMHQAGLSAATVLKSATWHAALALHNQADFGSVEQGKMADLLLLENNPLVQLNTLKQPLAVIKHGQWLDREKLQQLKQSANHPASYWVGLAWAVEDLLNRLWNMR